MKFAGEVLNFDYRTLYYYMHYCYTTHYEVANQNNVCINKVSRAIAFLFDQLTSQIS